MINGNKIVIELLKFNLIYIESGTIKHQYIRFSGTWVSDAVVFYATHLYQSCRFNAL